MRKMILQHFDAIFLSLFLLFSAVMCASDLEIVNTCCIKGENLHSENNNTIGEVRDCGDFPVPIANISQEHQTLCIATMEVCCLSAKRDVACQKGLQKARDGLTCR